MNEARGLQGQRPHQPRVHVDNGLRQCGGCQGTVLPLGTTSWALCAGEANRKPPSRSLALEMWQVQEGRQIGPDLLPGAWRGKGGIQDSTSGFCIQWRIES